MNNGGMRRAMVCVGLGFVAAGCGGSDAKDPKDTPNCGTAQNPTPIVLKDVSPALGASVPNSAIVQTFTIVGRHLLIDASFGLPVAHTAGQPIPALVHWTPVATGADTVYTSEPFAWTTAPAHVEVDSAGLLQTSDGCISALPTQLFKYDVTAP